MAKISYFSLLLLILAMAFVIGAFVIEVVHAGGEGSLRPEECGNACAYRCSETHHRKPCLFFCNKCCAECLCVPSGTYGHKEECPCYNDWKTQEGGPKCP